MSLSFMGQNGCACCKMYSAGLLLENIGDQPRGSTLVLPRCTRVASCIIYHERIVSCEGTCTLRYNYIIFKWYTVLQLPPPPPTQRQSFCSVHQECSLHRLVLSVFQLATPVCLLVKQSIMTCFTLHYEYRAYFGKALRRFLQTEKEWFGID